MGTAQTGLVGGVAVHVVVGSPGGRDIVRGPRNSNLKVGASGDCADGLGERRRCTC